MKANTKLIKLKFKPARRSKDKYKRVKETNKKQAALVPFVKSITEGKTYQQAISQIAKDKKLPAHELKKYIREQQDIIQKQLIDIQSIAVSKSKSIMESMRPEAIHDNSKAIASAILLDKGLKLGEVLHQESEQTPQEKLTEFITSNQINFATLLNIIKTNKCPPEITSETFRTLQNILHSIEVEKVIDIEKT